jgi:glutathione S-transferase
MQCRL